MSRESVPGFFYLRLYHYKYTLRAQYLRLIQINLLFLTHSKNKLVLPFMQNKHQSESSTPIIRLTLNGETQNNCSVSISEQKIAL